MDQQGFRNKHGYLFRKIIKIFFKYYFTQSLQIPNIINKKKISKLFYLTSISSSIFIANSREFRAIIKFTQHNIIRQLFYFYIPYNRKYFNMKNSREIPSQTLNYYQEMSSIIRRAYNQENEIPLSIQINEIMQWIVSEQEKPLLITSEPQGGKKSLLCQLIRQLDCQWGSKCILISEFASISPYFAQILYKIMSRLRNSLNIQQKVELNEQKLRQYFRYWLEVADEKIEKQYLGYEKAQKAKIVIIIEGVDKVLDSKGRKISTSFWLPNAAFKNIKIIFTANNNSNAVESLKEQISKKIQFILQGSKVEQFRSQLEAKDKRLTFLEKDTHIENIKLVSKILQKSALFPVNNMSSPYDIFKQYINFIETPEIGKKTIINILGLLSESKKGLTKATIKRSLKIKLSIVEYTLKMFEGIILETKMGYLIISQRVKQYIQNILGEEMPDQKYTAIKKSIHAALVKSLTKQSVNENQLEQTIYHLVGCEDYTGLKQILSRIQNFLLLYTPLTKHILCICWLQLELKFQYDPVFEYNKAIERFLNHYYPSSEDTFKIVFQLSLFFKEYSQFQNYKTPVFRHPPIRGEVEHIKEISIYEELMKMGMYEKSKQKNKQGFVVKKGNELESNMEKAEKKSNVTNPKQSKEQGRESAQTEKKEVESLNVKIKFHQQKFKDFYLKEMELYLNEFFVPRKKHLMNKKDKLLDEDSDDPDQEIQEIKIDIDKIKKSLLLKKYADYSEEIYHRFSQKRSFYYYKQWIWMQFPWISQSLQYNYSQEIKNCIKSPTEYMSVEYQHKLIHDAVEISKIAKSSKENIYKSQSQLYINNPKIKALTSLSPSQSLLKESRDVKSSSKLKLSGLLKSSFISNISKIQQELRKYPKKSRCRKFDDSSFSINNSNVFMTENTALNNSQDNKQNSDGQKQKLPKIYESKISSLATQIKYSNTDDIMKNRSYNYLISKLDAIKHENSDLSRNIEKLKQSQNFISQNMTKQQRMNELRSQIEGLQQKKAKIARNHKNQHKFKEKLEMIIKVCDVNKSHGSQSADLNQFLTSLKFMNQLQAQKIEHANAKCKRVLEEQREEYRGLKQEKIKLIQRIKKQQTKINKGNHPKKSDQKLMGVSRIQKKDKKQKQQLLLKAKLEAELAEVNSRADDLHQQLGIIIDFEHHNANSTILEEYEGQANKYNELVWKLKQIEETNNKKQWLIASLQQRKKITEGFIQHNKESKTRTIQNEMQFEEKKLIERINCLKKCLEMVS